MSTERVTVSLSNEHISELDAKCKKYEFTRQEYIKFLLGCPEPCSVHSILQIARSRFNVGDSFQLDELIREVASSCSASQRANLTRRCYSWIHKYSPDFAVNPITRRVYRLY